MTAVHTAEPIDWDAVPPLPDVLEFNPFGRSIVVPPDEEEDESEPDAP